jgi:hypothetical protein
MEDYDDSATYEFMPQRYGPQQSNYASAQPRYAPKQSRYGPQQPRYDNQRYNGGQFVDPVEQLRLLLQAVPIANAPQPALAYQVANQLAQVHHQVPPAAPPAAPPQLNLGASANANAAAAANPWKSSEIQLKKITAYKLVYISKFDEKYEWYYSI